MAVPRNFSPGSPHSAGGADVTGFLDDMAAASRTRTGRARAREPLAALRRRCADLPRPPALRHGGRFEVIAELKLRSPAQGALSSADSDIGQRVADYAAAGAVAVSVLTEPQRFAGSLDHLRGAALALAGCGVPAMRKDFLVDPYQLYEARAAGAGGALLIVRMLALPQLEEMLDCARELGLFVLLEAFDEADLEVATGLVARHTATGTRGRIPDTSRPRPALDDELYRAPLLVGVNCRDLQTLEVVPDRLAALALHLPQGRLRVAESGLSTPDDTARIARAGYDTALVGSALMRAPDPGALLQAMIAAGRAAS